MRAPTYEEIDGLARFLQITNPELSPWRDLDEEDKIEARRIAKMAWDYVLMRLNPEPAWRCPIGHKGCTQNCGNYGCGN